jgi:transposase InsO family protein
VKWTYFYLYVILDVFSRYVTGWMVAMRESADTEDVKQNSHEVIDRVIRRAEELRRNWSKANGGSPRSSARVSAATTV